MFDQRLAVPVMTVQELVQRGNCRLDVKIYLTGVSLGKITCSLRR